MFNIYMMVFLDIHKLDDNDIMDLCSDNIQYSFKFIIVVCSGDCDQNQIFWPLSKYFHG